MIRKNQAFLNRVNILIDMLLVVLSYILASWIRLDFLDGYSGNMAAVSGKTVLLASAYAVLLFFLLSMLGFYNVTRVKKMSWIFRTLFLGITLATLIGTTVLFVFKLVDFSRGVILAFYVITLVLLTGKYALTRLMLNRFRGKGYNLKHIIVIGTGPMARQFQQDIEHEPELGFHIKGFIGKEDTQPDDSNRLHLVGMYDRMDEALSSPDISEVVIALEPEEYNRLFDIIPACERNGVKYSVIPFYNNIIPDNPVIETIGQSKLINMRVNRLENVGWAILKRGLDIVISFLSLVLLSPLFLIIAIGVKCSSPGPILFRQTRVGYQRRKFQMLKFRSMKVNDEQDTAWSKERDDRRTGFGSFIRKTSLDELPQLFNVLKGEMSLVGPRPELPHFVEEFKKTIPYYMVKHQVKPGMTGWAQVNGFRGDTSIEKRIELDLWYIEHWSLWLDIRIILRTIFGGAVNAEKMK